MTGAAGPGEAGSGSQPPALPAGPGRRGRGAALGAAASSIPRAAPLPPPHHPSAPPAGPGTARTAPTGSRAPCPGRAVGLEPRPLPGGRRGRSPPTPCPAPRGGVCGGGGFLALGPARRFKGLRRAFPSPKAAVEEWEGSAWETGPAAAPGRALGGGAGAPCVCVGCYFPIIFFFFSALKADGFIGALGGGRDRPAPPATAEPRRKLRSKRLLIRAAPLLPGPKRTSNCKY